MAYVLETFNLSKRYKKQWALKDVNIHISKGDIYGFVGGNGSGKTTVIRLVTGLISATEGGVALFGVRNDDPAILEQRKKVGAIVETPSIYLNMSAAVNLRLQSSILGIVDDVEEKIKDVLAEVGLSAVYEDKKKASNFSLGMRQRLGIAMAMAGNPDFLVLDEPTNGLDPQGIIDMRELILKLNREYHITVLISSHILDELSRLATHYGIIDNGCMVKELNSDELESLCRKCMRTEVSNMTGLIRVLNNMGVDYNVVSDTQADIFSKLNISQLVFALAKENCEIISIETRDESLESVFISLIGGGNNA